MTEQHAPKADLFIKGMDMAIKGINHLTFIVRDLERTARLLCQGLGAHEVYDSQHKNYSLSREKFFVLGGIWLVIMEGEAGSVSGSRPTLIPPASATPRQVASMMP